MARFFLPPEAWNAPALTGDEARHLSQVLRTKAGETITVFDGGGRRALAEVLQVSRDHVPLKLGEMLAPKSTGPAITLAQAIPKGKNMDLIVQKAVELGISAIQPLITRNTVVQPGEGKADKWRRTALEACKQCGQDTLPRIAEPIAFEQWMMSRERGDLDVIASLEERAAPIKTILRSREGSQRITILIGPEGDFTAPEYQLAVDQGFASASLGDIVMRVETATLYCLSVLKYEFC